jgi:hypothetical protein
MLDLISTTEDIHYENYRQQQMETRKFGEPRVKKSDNPKFKEEEEALRKRFTEQVKSEEARFRQWEQHVRFVLIKKKLSSLCSPPPCSSSRNATDSIRIWKWLTVPLRALKLNWTTFKSATGGGLVDDRRLKALSISFGIPLLRSLVCHSPLLDHIHPVCRWSTTVMKEMTSEQT